MVKLLVQVNAFLIIQMLCTVRKYFNNQHLHNISINPSRDFSKFVFKHKAKQL